ncbi:NAC domain-containing protein 68-like [Telopea speciosissima]|uniref:NAC domain-containing protein 68-like n=1 Tax=Telopea speciosissima TaxID=54955 RepID=UPI001CC6060A|nr:NAC domain-containing protein 68-like [Telopea speciosissima]
MGDPNPKNVRAIPISIPPGFRFYPTEEQLLCYYLTNKNNCAERHECDLSFPSISDVNFSPFGLVMVKEIDLYGYDPCDLPEIACFPYGRGGSRKHWYCFTAKVSTERLRRKARGGFWKMKGRARDILGGKEGPVLGKRNTFVFYRRNSSLTMKTDWVLYEYALVDHLKDSFTLCRVFFKSHPGNKIAEHIPSSCIDKSIAAMHNTDVDAHNKQHDRASGSGIGEVLVAGIGEVLVHAETSFGTDNDIQGLPMKSTSEPCDSILAQQASDDGFRFPMTIPQLDQLVESSNGIVSGSSRSTICVGIMTDQLISNSVILEGDFIELNDLISPLPDVDS